MGGGLGHFRHEPHENPATELAELPIMETICRRAASVRPGVQLLRLLRGLQRGYKTQDRQKLCVFSMDRRTPSPPDHIDLLN